MSTSEFEEFPEEGGYFNEPGFVKNNPLNNEAYLAKCKNQYPEWADILQEAHDKIVVLDPGYNICQIKSKFGGLRFYIGVSTGLDEDVRKEIFEISHEAERQAGLLQ